MSIVITRLFDDYDQALHAVRDLEAAGIAHDNVSLVASNSDGSRDTAGTATTTSGTTRGGTAMTDDASTGDETGTGAGTGATLGTLLGGGAGLLAGLGMLAIPGVGPVVAAGWLIATAVGAGVGAASGGLLGSLVGAGVSEEDANVYAEGVRRGGTLVTVRADDGQGSMIEQVMAKYNAVDATARGEEYRSGGWSKFDETAPAYSATGAGMGAPTGSGAGMPVGSTSTTMPGVTTGTGATPDTTRR